MVYFILKVGFKSFNSKFIILEDVLRINVKTGSFLYEMVKILKF